MKEQSERLFSILEGCQEEREVLPGTGPGAAPLPSSPRPSVTRSSGRAETCPRAAAGILPKSSPSQAQPDPRSLRRPPHLRWGTQGLPSGLHPEQGGQKKGFMSLWECVPPSQSVMSPVAWLCQAPGVTAQHLPGH